MIGKFIGSIRPLTALFAGLVFASVSGAQSAHPDTVRQELQRINKVFDSSVYLGFDLNIRYTSDTAYGKYDYEELAGNYVLNNRNIYYKMGQIEYMQNDSFSFTLYHDEKLMTMARDSIGVPSALFPIKEFVDSALAWYGARYAITLRNDGDSRVIDFTAKDSTAPYDRFSVYYDRQTYYPDRFDVFYTESLDEQQSASAYDILKPQHKRISLLFSNYSRMLRTDVFDPAHYVIYDRSRNQYLPTDVFREYTFIPAGVSDDQDDETIDQYQPPIRNN